MPENNEISNSQRRGRNRPGRNECRRSSGMAGYFRCSYHACGASRRRARVAGQ